MKISVFNNANEIIFKNIFFFLRKYQIIKLMFFYTENNFFVKKILNLPERNN